MADLEHLVKVVESRHAGGIGSRGLGRGSLHHARWLQLDTSGPTPCRGTGGAAGAKRILRHDHAIRGEPLAGCTPLCVQPVKISQVKPFLLQRF